jgi:hypothetical protein
MSTENKFRTKKELLLEGLKQCQVCGEIKELDFFHFKSGSNKRARRADCKVCRKARNAKYYQSRRAKAQALKVAQLVEE